MGGNGYGIAAFDSGPYAGQKVNDSLGQIVAKRRPEAAKRRDEIVKRLPKPSVATKAARIARFGVWRPQWRGSASAVRRVRATL
jgi:hypothetical protein